MCNLSDLLPNERKEAMCHSYRASALKELKQDGYPEDYIEDWLRVYDATGLDMRDMEDGMDVDAFLEAYEEDDLEGMIMNS